MWHSTGRSGRLALLIFVAVAAGLCAAPALAAAPAATSLIDRELFFGDPEIAGAQISPDGRYIAFIKPFLGTRNIWVKQTQQPFDAAKPLTADAKRPIPGFFWSRDSKVILYVQDSGGDENYNIWAVDPAGSPAAGQKVPTARNLTELKAVAATIYAVPRSAPDVIYVGLNDRDAAWHDVYRIKISTGERTLVRTNTERIAQWFFDNAGTLRLAGRIADNGDSEVLRVDEAGFTKVYSCSVFESCEPVRYHKDNRRVYMNTNKGDDVDLSRLTLFDPDSGKEELVESDPEKRVDFGAAVFSDLTDELVATGYEDERIRTYFRDKALETDYKWLKKRLPGMEVSLGSSTTDELRWLVAATSDTEPGATYLFDRKAKKLSFQYRVYAQLPRKDLAPMQALRFKSSDGLEIPAFLTLPKGVPAKNLPLIVFPHGGPWSRDTWGYDPYAQFLANRGYAVLQPNFRSSIGYGKRFLNAGNNEWGQKMQDDLTWGVKDLVAKGIADPKRVGIMGGSYGGYAALAGVAFTPDVYAAAVSIVGPSNLITLLDSIPPYWESLRKIFYMRMGDPQTPEGKAQLQRQSPLNAAKNIVTPLLVVQGANDPRVNKAESDQIVIALRDRKFPVEYIVAPDEGHGFRRPVNNMALFAATEQFLAKHLGGRYQASMTPEVAQRRSEITVDVNTVVLPKKLDAAAVGVPKPAADLLAGTSRYASKIAIGEQTIDMTIAREIKEEGANWIITDLVKTPMGDAEDRTTIAKGTLVVLSRAVKQGPVTIDVSFKDNKANGTMTIGGQSNPIAVDLGGAVFADGAGYVNCLAALPLADGYSTSFRNFDLQTQKEKLRLLKVAGRESVTVAAGTFDTWRVDVTSATDEADKLTLWVVHDTRNVVKAVAVVPQMNGATITTELVP